MSDNKTTQARLSGLETSQNVEYGDEFRKCRDILSRKEAMNPIDSLSEIAKIIAVKIVEERSDENRFSRSFLSQSDDPIDRFNRLLSEAVSTLPNLSLDQKLDIRYESTLLNIVDILSEFGFASRSASGGDMYQTFVRESLRGEFGQFFTPQEIGEFMASVLDPSPDSTILDPAAGPAGFLATCHNYLDRLYGKVNADIYGVEVEPTIHELAVLNFFTHGLNPEHMLRGDSLNPPDQNYPISPSGGFDTILANPPFSIDVEDEDILSSFDLGKSGHQETDILFTEKCIDLLGSSGGRFGIVLPEGFLNTSEYDEFRSYLLSNCTLDAIISLPAGAFVPFGKSMARTCLIFGSVNDSRPTFQDRVFLGEASEVGYECGKTDYAQIEENDLGNFINIIDESDVDDGVIETQAGGRASWVAEDVLSKDRLDPRNYFQQIDDRRRLESDVDYRSFGDVADVVQQKITPSDSPDEEFIYLEIPEMRDETGIVDRYNTCNGCDINGRKVRFEGGDLILSRINPTKSRITIVPPHIENGVTSNEIYNIRPKNGETATKYYLYRYLKSEPAMEYIRNHVTGSSSSRHRLGKDDLKEMPVPIPDLEKQEEIANPLMDAFDDLWSGYRKFFRAHEKTDFSE